MEEDTYVNLTRDRADGTQIAHNRETACNMWTTYITNSALVKGYAGRGNVATDVRVLMVIGQVIHAANRVAA